MLENTSCEALMLRVKELEAIIELHDQSSTIPFCFHSLDKEGLFVDINQNELNLIGYTREEVVGKLNVLDILSPSSREVFANNFSKFKTEGSLKNLELDFVKKNGQIFPVVVNSIAHYDQMGCFVYSTSIVLDNTSIRKTELRLEESEEKFKVLFEFLPVGITISDLNGNIISGNKEAEKLLKTSVKDQRERTIDDQKWKIIRRDGSIMPTKEFASVMAIQQLKRIENVEMGIVDEDGNTTWINVTAAPLPNKEGVIVAYSNINEEVERENKLKEYSNQLKDANAMKDRFLSIIAHDLKNPFNSILGFSDLLMNNLDTYEPEKIRRFVSIIDQAAKHTLELLDNLLVWTRSQLGGLTFTPSTINLIDVIHENANLVISQASHKGIQLIVKPAPDIFIQADKNMINTIIRNLITNAIKFTPTNGMIVVSTNEGKNHIELSIRDSGVGIEPENLTKLFKIDDKFTQTGTASETGTGLGLLLCKDFIEKHGGTIKVDSEFGIGSNFTVFFPKNNIVEPDKCQ